MNILSKDIIKEWGITHLSEDEKDAFIERTSTTLFQAILVRALDILSEKEEEELDYLLDKDTTKTQDILLFLQSKIPTFEMLVEEERQKIKDDTLMPVS